MTSFSSSLQADQIRYAIAANAPETQDAEFTWKDFQSRCNSELLGKYGNLANRLLVFIAQHCQGKIPPSHVLDESDRAFLDKITVIAAQIEDAYSHFHLREKASQLVMELATAGNVYFDAKKPWVLAKDPTQRATLETVSTPF